MTVQDIYDMAVLVQGIIEENDFLKSENKKLQKEVEEHQKWTQKMVDNHFNSVGETIGLLLKRGQNQD